MKIKNNISKPIFKIPSKNATCDTKKEVLTQIQKDEKRIRDFFFHEIAATPVNEKSFMKNGKFEKGFIDEKFDTFLKKR